MTSQPSSHSTQRKKLTLPDGRVLSYTAYGFPHGTPTFFHHSSPSSSLEAAIWHHAAQRLKLLLISPDRPGIGHSSPLPNRTLLDWPADITALADSLDFDQFYILGVAGGAPYVLACLKEISCKRIKGAAVVSGIFPLSVGAEGMLFGSWVALILAGWVIPTRWLAWVLDWFLGRVARDDQHPGKFEEVFMREARGRPGVDRKCLEERGYRGMIVEAVRESFRMGADGVACEAGILGRGWGFELEDVGPKARSGRVSIWQGGRDDACPVPMARKAGAKLGGVEVRVLEEEGHLSLSARHSEDILRRLVESE